MGLRVFVKALQEAWKVELLNTSCPVRVQKLRRKFFVFCG